MEPFIISFVIPCFNAGTFLREAVESIKRQTGDFTVADIVVVDDRSDDRATAAALREIANIENVHVLENAGPRGAAGARNTGISRATGNWIAFMDADDILLEDSLNLRCRTAAGFPDCQWISADYQVLREDGTTDEHTFFASRPLPRQYFARAFATKRPIRLERPVAPFVDCCLSKIGANLFHRHLIERIGEFDTELTMAEDHQYFIRAANISDMIFVPKSALLYRRHDKNTTNADVPPGFWPIRSLELLSSRHQITEPRRAIRRKLSFYHLANAYHFRKKNVLSSAIREAVAAIGCKPQSAEAWRCLFGAVLAR